MNSLNPSSAESRACSSKATLRQHSSGSRPRSRNLSMDGDSDYEDGGPEDESLEMARRAYNQQLSDAYKDGFREGFDKGQIKLAQDVFNESHSSSAKSQVPYGQYLGIIKVLEAKILTTQQSSASSINTDEDEVKAILDLSNSTYGKPMTRTILLTRLKTLRDSKVVSRNGALVSLIKETEESLAKLN